jgi:hypothetical protein
MNLIKYTCHIFFTDISVAFRDYNAEIIVDAKILFRSAKITNDERFLRTLLGTAEDMDPFFQDSV